MMGTLTTEAISYTQRSAIGFRAGPEIPPVPFARTGAPDSASTSMPGMVLMAVMPSAPASDGRARNLSDIGDVRGELHEAGQGRGRLDAGVTCSRRCGGSGEHLSVLCAEVRAGHVQLDQVRARLGQNGGSVCKILRGVGGNACNERDPQAAAGAGKPPAGAGPLPRHRGWEAPWH